VGLTVEADRTFCGEDNTLTVWLSPTGFSPSGWRDQRPAVSQTTATVAMTMAAMARALYEDGRHTVAVICRTLKVSRATLYRYLKRDRDELFAASGGTPTGATAGAVADAAPHARQKRKRTVEAVSW